MKFLVPFIISTICCLNCFSQIKVNIIDSASAKVELSFDAKNKADINKAIQKILFTKYENNFFYAKLCSKSDSSKNEYNYYINEGNKVYLKLLDKKNIEKNLLRKIEKSSKNNKLFKMQENIIAFYENSGYPFAKVSLNITEIKNDSICAEFKIDKGCKIQIDSVNLKGKYKANSNFICSWLNLKKGELYDERKIRKINEKIKLSDIASQTQNFEIVFTDNKANINLFLSKKKANSFDGIIGFAPNANNPAKLIFNGDVFLKVNNAINHGEEIILNWENNGSGIQELSVQGELPYAIGLPLGISAHIDIFKKDSSYVSNKQRYGINYYSGIKNKSCIFFEHYTNNVLDKTIFEQASNIIDNKSSMIGISFSAFKADQNIIPRKGFDFQFETSVGNKDILKNKNAPNNFYDSLNINSSIFKYLHDINFYFNIYKSWHLVVRNQSGILQNSDLFENDLFRLGGLKTIRGFDQSSISASKYSITSGELRFFLEQQSFINIFADLGFAKVLKNKIFDNQSYVSFGTGLSFFTKAGIFSLYYALGKEFDNKISLKNGKIHFGIMSKF